MSVKACWRPTLSQDQRAMHAALSMPHRAARAARVAPNPVPPLGAYEKGCLWTPGSTLRVAFDGFTRAQRHTVIEALNILMTYANVRFVVVFGDAEIRVAGDPSDGSWSYVGTEVLAIPQNQPTMNLGWGPDLPTTLHEFSHALGRIHEHQNPSSDISWIPDVVIAYYAAPPNYWTPEQTTAQVLTKADPAATTFGDYDRASIMEYPILSQLVSRPSDAVGENATPSNGDIELFRLVYPY